MPAKVNPPDPSRVSSTTAMDIRYQPDESENFPSNIDGKSHADERDVEMAILDILGEISAAVEIAIKEAPFNMGGATAASLISTLEGKVTGLIGEKVKAHNICAQGLDQIQDHVVFTKNLLNSGMESIDSVASSTYSSVYGSTGNMNTAISAATSVVTEASVNYSTACIEIINDVTGNIQGIAPQMLGEIGSTVAKQIGQAAQQAAQATMQAVQAVAQAGQQVARGAFQAMQQALQQPEQQMQQLSSQLSQLGQHDHSGQFQDINKNDVSTKDLHTRAYQSGGVGEYDGFDAVNTSAFKTAGMKPVAFNASQLNNIGGASRGMLGSIPNTMPSNNRNVARTAAKKTVDSKAGITKKRVSSRIILGNIGVSSSAVEGEKVFVGADVDVISDLPDIVKPVIYDFTELLAASLRLYPNYEPTLGLLTTREGKGWLLATNEELSYTPVDPPLSITPISHIPVCDTGFFTQYLGVTNPVGKLTAVAEKLSGTITHIITCNKNSVPVGCSIPATLYYTSHVSQYRNVPPGDTGDLNVGAVFSHENITTDTFTGLLPPYSETDPGEVVTYRGLLPVATGSTVTFDNTSIIKDYWIYDGLTALQEKNNVRVGLAYHMVVNCQETLEKINTK